MDNDILNIDCETDIDERIQDWSNRLSAQIQLIEELRALLPRDLLNFIIHKTSGNVYRFIESLDELERSRIATTNAMTTFKNVVARIVQEFIGRIPEVKASNEAFREHAYWRLVNLKICNMCYLDPFICEFSDQYYKLDSTRQKAALEMFFKSVSTKLKDMYNALLQDGTRIQDTLGARITTLKAWMKKECLQETAKKEAQFKLCCEMQSDKVGHYANICPKKGEKKETEVLKMAYNLGSTVKSITRCEVSMETAIHHHLREKKGSNLSTYLKQICSGSGSGVTSKEDSSITRVDSGGPDY
ncbi:coat protein [Tanacetum coccineum]